MNYEEMSDFEINKRVADVLGFSYIGRGSIDDADGVYSVVEMGGYRTDLRDYCNNPSHSFTIILENEISLVVVDDSLWVARVGGIYSESANPLRAAMIVFLMMQESK